MFDFAYTQASTLTHSHTALPNFAAELNVLCVIGGLLRLVDVTADT